MQHRTTVQITFGLKTYKCIFVLQTGQISGFPLLHAHHLAFAHSCIIQRHIHHPYVWLLICKAQTECGNGSDQMNRYQCHKGIALKLIKNTSQRFLDKSCDRVCVWGLRTTVYLLDLSVFGPVAVRSVSLCPSCHRDLTRQGGRPLRPPTVPVSFPQPPLCLLRGLTQNIHPRDCPCVNTARSATWNLKRWRHLCSALVMFALHREHRSDCLFPQLCRPERSMRPAQAEQ